jgi:DNA-binding NtrC family response regulator
MKGQLENLTLQMYGSGIRYAEGLREFQKVFILTVLRDQKWNQVKAAKKLSVHRNTLRRLIRNLQLDIRSLRAAGGRRPPESERPLPLEKKERAT